MAIFRKGWGVSFVDVRPGKDLGSFEMAKMADGKPRHIRPKAINPDFTRIAFGNLKVVELWDVSTKTIKWSWSKPEDCKGDIREVHFQPNGKQLVV
jgi:hypothetical protein